MTVLSHIVSLVFNNIQLTHTSIHEVTTQTQSVAIVPSWLFDYLQSEPVEENFSILQREKEENIYKQKVQIKSKNLDRQGDSHFLCFLAGFLHTSLLCDS